MNASSPPSTRTRLAIVVALALSVAWVSLTPGDGTEDSTGFVWLVAVTPTLLQKLAHVVVYAALAVLWTWALPACITRRFLLAGWVALGEGVLLEVLQTQVPGRFGTLTDVLVNAAGVGLGLAIAFRFRR